MPDGDSGFGGVGGTIASRIAGHLQRALVMTRQQLGPHQAGVAQVILRDFTNHVSDELRGVLGSLWAEFAADPGMDPRLKALMGKLATERGQAWAWAAGSTTSIALGGGVTAWVTNYLQPVISSSIRASPNLPLSPADAAHAVARGVWSRDRAERDASGQGLNEDRFGRLVELNRVYPAIGELLELYGRHHIPEGVFRAWAQRQGMPADISAVLANLAKTHISLQDGAAMWNRSIVDTNQLRLLALRGGYDPGDADRYAELAGEPLPVQDLLTALRRGVIDEGRARRGWVQGPTRNEWFDVALRLQFAPMSTVDAADSVNQGHMSKEEGARIAHENGLRPEHFDTLIENAGLPPGVELATEALNRGLLTESQFRQAFLESRLKNRYVSLYEELRWRVIPQETVRRLYRKGVYTRDQAAERLKWNGFSPEDREALLLAEDTETDASTKELTKAEILSLLSDRAVDEATAREMLLALEYSPAEVEWLVTIAYLRRTRKYMDAVIARARAGYVAGRLGVSEVTSLMDSLRVPVDQREELISLWDLERVATTRGLTPAQVRAAMRKGLIDQADAVERLVRDGYSAVDAEVLLSS